MTQSRLPLRATTVAAVLAAAGLSGCGGAEQHPAPLALLNTQSVWVPGQDSLLGFDAYATIADRAAVGAQLRRDLRDLELARIEAARKAAERRLTEEARRKYEEAKRKAQEAYRQALRDAARQRRIQARRLAAAKRKRARELAELRKKLQVKPGDECKIPEVAQYFECRKGMTPLPKPLPKG
jgi:hypothetical protein